MDKPFSPELVNALKTVRHPKTGMDVVASGIVESALINGSMATVTLSIEATDAGMMEPIRKACEDAALTVAGVAKARAIMTAKSGHGHAHNHAPGKPAHVPPPTPKALKGVRKILAVASGKGGVGKSTTAVNLAYAMQRAGLRTAFIDCDIYGPSAALLLGVKERPQFTEDNRIRPIFRDGVATMSMSYIVGPDTAAIWRGPMVIQTVQQFLTGVAWDERGDIDFAIIDLPPGTGDVQLTLAQTAEVDGAIIVSTPQDLALIDARKAVDMFRKTNTPILGVVENMSYFSCPKCGERTDIFGHGGARQTAANIGVAFLGEIPLHLEIRKASDAGVPIVCAQPDSEHASRYRSIANAVIDAMAVPPPT